MLVKQLRALRLYPFVFTPRSRHICILVSVLGALEVYHLFIVVQSLVRPVHWPVREPTKMLVGTIQFAILLLIFEVELFLLFRFPLSRWGYVYTRSVLLLFYIPGAVFFYVLFIVGQNFFLSAPLPDREELTNQNNVLVFSLIFSSLFRTAAYLFVKSEVEAYSGAVADYSTIFQVTSDWYLDTFMWVFCILGDFLGPILILSGSIFRIIMGGWQVVQEFLYHLFPFKTPNIQKKRRSSKISNRSAIKKKKGQV